MVQRHPLVAYFALAYLITWTCQFAAFALASADGVGLENEDNFLHFADLLTLDLPAERLVPLLLFNVGQFGPFISAFLLTGLLYGGVGVRDLALRIVRWRVAPFWYVVVIALPLLLATVALAVAFATSGFQLPTLSPALAWGSLLGFLLYVIVFNGLAEEPGWRGFALPHLQARYSADRSSWILGPLWGVWHLPFLVFLNLSQPFAVIPLLFALILGIVGWTIVNTWIYNSTRSVLVMVLLHGWYVAVQSYLILSQSNALVATVYSFVPWVIAILLVKRYGEDNLAPVSRPKWWPGRYSVEQRGADADRAATAPQAG